MKAIICDICGKRMVGESHYFHLNMEEYKPYPDISTLNLKTKQETWDVCKECAYDIIGEVEKRSKTK